MRFENKRFFFLSNVSSKRSLGEKLMSSKDFRKVEQELQDTLNFPIFNANVPRVCQGKGWSSPSFGMFSNVLLILLN